MPKKKKSAPRFVLPEGFTPHHGGPCPVASDAFVEPIIRTAEGYGSAGVIRAKFHVWPHDHHDDEGGLGAVVGYRLARRDEPPRFGLTERF